MKNQKSKIQLKTKNLGKILERESELLELVVKKILPIGAPKIDAVAVTHGPGLAPALWVGINFARALSYIWERPLIPINHMEGHIFSAMLKKYGNSKQSQSSKIKIQKNHTPACAGRLYPIPYPALALLVSGGHTELVLIKKLGKYKIVGETVDDAVGECFDKVARILDLPYPGGPEISRLADTFNIKHSALDIKLPRPMIHSKDFNFSFSGLKTAVLYLTKDLKDSYLLPEVKAAIAKEFQDAAVEVLVKKTMAAAKKYKAKTIILGGGVAANSLLRKELSVRCQVSRVKCLLPSPAITGDNALMIALAAAITGKIIKRPQALKAEANLRLS